MAVKNRFKLQKGKPGANANGQETSVSGMILTGVAVAAKLVLGTPYKITNADALTDFGLNAAYDTANSCLVYYHLKEFFRMANEGTTLYFMVVAQTILPAVMLEDTGSLYAKKLLLAAQGKIYKLGIAFSPAVGYTETLTDGFNADCRAAIPKAKILRDWAADRNMPLDVIIEGRKYGGNAATSVDLRNIIISSETISYEGITVVIGQDFTYAESLAWALGKYHAAVGTFLGTYSSIEMQQDAGEVETLNITDVDNNVFVVAGLSNHVTIEDSDDQLDTLDDKGYVFAMKYVDVSGFRWNGDHVCAPIIIDAEGTTNEWKLSYSCAVNFVSRKLYGVLIPKVRTTHAVDQNTGKLPLAKIKYFEALGDGVFNDLADAGHISGGKTFVDPDSDLMRPPQELRANFLLVPFGTIGRINATISLKTNL